MITEKRREVRKRTFLKGRILFNKGAASMDCLVRDLSEGGARLELSATSTLPDVFDLYIPQREETLRAGLRWRRENAVGVFFVDREAPAAPAIDLPTATLLRRVAELEAENAALRAMIVRLEGRSED